MLFLPQRFGKEENRCGASTIESFRRPAGGGGGPANWLKLSSGTQFQTFESGGDAQPNLALQAERLQRDRVVGATDQHVATGADADRRTALRAGVIAGDIARSEPPRR